VTKYSIFKKLCHLLVIFLLTNKDDLLDPITPRNFHKFFFYFLKTNSHYYNNLLDKVTRSIVENGTLGRTLKPLSSMMTSIWKHGMPFACLERLQQTIVIPFWTKISTIIISRLLITHNIFVMHYKIDTQHYWNQQNYTRVNMHSIFLLIHLQIARIQVQNTST